MKEEELLQAEARLREEFNRWAEAGRGEEMGEEHAAIAAGMLAEMRFAPTDKILDLGCGAGWLCGLLADKAPQGQGVGVDVADEMIRRARQRHVERAHMMFVVGEAEDIPWDDNFFNHVVSVESAYYWPEPAKAFREIFRVLQPGGELRVLINLYRENAYSHPWRGKLGVPPHLPPGGGPPATSRSGSRAPPSSASSAARGRCWPADGSPCRARPSISPAVSIACGKARLAVLDFPVRLR